MENHHLMLLLPFFYLTLILSISPSHFSVVLGVPISNNPDGTSELQTYIIQLRPTANVTTANIIEDLEEWYASFLPNTTEATATSRTVHKYSEAMVGFAARLTAAELMEIEKKDGFLKAFPDRRLSLYTTHTPAFLGLQPEAGFWKDSNFGRGVIIGVLDTGIQPGHPSFSGNGMPPPPSKWKGVCDFKGTDCNNKIIGARSMVYPKGSAVPPTDDNGHGTHTASTAAGTFVPNASMLGYGNGTAAGMAPNAHLAIYKVCDASGCSSASLLAAMDAAIKDGVDVLSLSLGADGMHSPFDEDPIAIGAFAATEKGIIVSCAAGNIGPTPSTITNEAPWLLTVGASTMDRSIRVTVKLGDGQEFYGESLSQPMKFESRSFPLVSPPSGNCSLEVSREFDVKEKVVICQQPLYAFEDVLGNALMAAGAKAIILVNDKTDGDTITADTHPFPTSVVSYADGSKIQSYARSSKNPNASIIFEGTTIGNSSAPAVASFSSRGPSVAAPHILKPDIIGPGVNVIAAWPFQSGSSSHLSFQMISGTSMATPHLSGIAALIKSLHPDWSPAAIKSAIMTTSYAIRNDGKPIDDEQSNPASFYVMGAGHVDPVKAADPGLVYDITTDEYISYLCGTLRYNERQIEAITRRRVECASIGEISESELNYPSITVGLGASGTVTVNRTVTNVGKGGETYTAKVEIGDGVEVIVLPKELKFSKVNEKKRFRVSFRWRQSGKRSAEGELKWISEKHVVRSPLVIKDN